MLAASTVLFPRCGSRRMTSDRAPPPQTINKPNLLRHGCQHLKKKKINVLFNVLSFSSLIVFYLNAIAEVMFLKIYSIVTVNFDLSKQMLYRRLVDWNINYTSCFSRQLKNF